MTRPSGSRDLRRSLLTIILGVSACTGSIEPSGFGKRPDPSSSGQGGSSGQSGAQARPAACETTPLLGPRVRKLSDAELEQTLTQAIPGIAWQAGAFGDSQAAGTSFSTFADKQDLSQLVLGAALKQAKIYAIAGLAELRKRQPCLQQPAPSNDCVTQALTSFSRAVQHGQSTSDDVASALAAYDAARPSNEHDAAMKVVLASIILSPKTLFRFELAASSEKLLSAAELAQSLSYFVTGRAPDAELLDKAQDGSLLTQASYDKQVERLLALDDAAAQFARFADELLHFRRAAAKTEGGSGWSNAIGKDMVTETDTFLRSAYRSGASLSGLFTATQTPVSQKLAEFYGIPFDADSTSTKGAPIGFRFVHVERNRRAGLLDQGSVIVSLTNAGAMDPVARGHVLADRLFCIAMGAPPAAAVATKTPFEMGMTPRDRLAVHIKDPSCASCHSVMDPLGLAFEGFDADGRSRTVVPTYGGGSKAVDASGVVGFLRNGPEKFESSVEFSAIVAKAPEVGECFVRNLANFALGTEAIGQDACELQKIIRAASDNGGDLQLRDVVGQVAKLDLFKRRK